MLFCRFTDPVAFEALAKSVSLGPRVCSSSRKTRFSGLPDGQNRVILYVSNILTHYQRVTDGQTDRQTRRL